MRSLNPKTPLGIYYLGSSSLTPIASSPLPSCSHPVSQRATLPWTATELKSLPIPSPSQSTPQPLSTDIAPARCRLIVLTVLLTLSKPLSALIPPKSPLFPPRRLRSFPTSWASNPVLPKLSLSEGAPSIRLAALALFLTMVRRLVKCIRTLPLTSR